MIWCDCVNRPRNISHVLQTHLKTDALCMEKCNGHAKGTWNYIKGKKWRVKGHRIENYILSLVIISLVTLTLGNMYLLCPQRGETPSSARIHDRRRTRLAWFITKLQHPWRNAMRVLDQRRKQCELRFDVKATDGHILSEGYLWQILN